MGIIYLALIVLLVVAEWKIFEKAGQPGWAAIIPIYNVIILMKIIGKPWWWLLLMIIPIAGFVWMVWSINLLSKSFGRTEGFTVGLIFLSFIFIPILGFGEDRYIGPGGKPLFDSDIDSIGVASPNL